MGLMSHAQVNEISDKAVLDVPVQPVDTLKIAGIVEGQRAGHGRPATTAPTSSPRSATG